MARQLIFAFAIMGCLAATAALAQPIPYDDPIDDSAMPPPPDQPDGWAPEDGADVEGMPEVAPEEMEAYDIPTSTVWAQSSTYMTYPQDYDPGYAAYDPGYSVYTSPISISYYSYQPWWYRQYLCGVSLGYGYRPSYGTYYGGGYVTYGPGVSTYSTYYPSWYVSPYATYYPYRHYGERRYYDRHGHRSGPQYYDYGDQHDWHQPWQGSPWKGSPWAGSVDRDHRDGRDTGRDRQNELVWQNPSPGRSYLPNRRNNGSPRTFADQPRNTPWAQQTTGSTPTRSPTPSQRSAASDRQNVVSRMLQPRNTNTNTATTPRRTNAAPAASTPRRTNASPATPRSTNQPATVRTAPAPARVSRPAATVQRPSAPARQPAPAPRPAPQRVRRP